jgi:peptide/nickel transport system permease protein
MPMPITVTTGTAAFFKACTNTVAPMTVQATYICGGAMIIEAILSLVGAGTPLTIPSWGNIMAQGRALWQVKPFIVFFPPAFLSITGGE